MSEMVHYSGKLEVVDTLPDETLEEQCKRILAKHNYLELDSYCDCWREMLCEELYERYVIVNDTIYKVVEKKRKSIDEYVFEAYSNLDGSIEYEVMYYNGGCSFNEAIEEALENVIPIDKQYEENTRKLAEYEGLEKQGLLLRLPCKVGSTVYYINGKFILEYEVTGFSVDRTGVWLIYGEHHADENDKTYGYNFDVDKIGKTVFLTKAEAERALKEMD